MIDAILDCSRRKGVVLDAFAGSGTTLVAAHKTGRRGYGIELDPHYCDVILRRMAGIAKLDAVLVATGQKLEAVAAERGGMSKEEIGTKQINDGAANSVDGRRAANNKPKVKTDYQIDIRAALEDPVRVKRDGGITSVDPYEAMLRQNVRKSLVDKCVTSMKRVLGEAEKHKIIKEPPEAATGGIFIVPKELPEELQRKIFDDPDYGSGQQTSMWPIFEYVLSVVRL